jgi:hypothetical protein
MQSQQERLQWKIDRAKARHAAEHPAAPAPSVFEKGNTAGPGGTVKPCDPPAAPATSQPPKGQRLEQPALHECRWPACACAMRVCGTTYFP